MAARLTLYRPPDGSCPSPWGYFTSSVCGWSVSSFCPGPYCDLNESESIDSVPAPTNAGCRQVESQTTHPEATVAGSVDCGEPGSGGWCRGGASLSLSGTEPLAGYSIIGLEGTHNSTPFYCSGLSCSLPLVEGGNDFDFWAISSWGDTSRMDSAGGSLDSSDPSLDGSISGTGGDNGWFVSEVTISASASDAVSGIASLDVKVDGGGWVSYGGPITLGEGSHNVDLRAVDVAGNTATESLSIDIDSVAPFVDLDAVPSFCPGCGETLGILIIVQDGGSGIADWDLTADGAGVVGGGSTTNQTITWDGSRLGAGLHDIDLDAHDVAGNQSGASFTVNLVLPTPTPTEVPTRTPVPTETPEPPSLFDLFSAATPSATPQGPSAATPTRLPTATRTPLTILFGAPPPAPADPAGSGPPADPFAGATPPGSMLAMPSGVVYGGAALALGAAATAYALDQARKRKEEEARQRRRCGA